MGREHEGPTARLEQEVCFVGGGGKFHTSPGGQAETPHGKHLHVPVPICHLAGFTGGFLI